MDAQFLVWRVRLWVAALAVVFIAAGHGQRPETIALSPGKAPLANATAVCAAVDGQANANCATRIKEASVAGKPGATRL